MSSRYQMLVCARVCVCVCVLGLRYCVTWDQVTVEPQKEMLFFGVTETLLTNWMRCKSSQQASDFEVTCRSAGEGRKVLHTCRCLSRKQPRPHLFTRALMCHANGCRPLRLWCFINFAGRCLVSIRFSYLLFFCSFVVCLLLHCIQ